MFTAAAFGIAHLAGAGLFHAAHAHGAMAVHAHLAGAGHTIGGAALTQAHTNAIHTFAQYAGQKLHDRAKTEIINALEEALGIDPDGTQGSILSMLMMDNGTPTIQDFVDSVTGAPDLDEVIIESIKELMNQ